MHNNAPDKLPDISHITPVRREKLEGGQRFVMHTPFTAAGDQPTAIAELSQGVTAGEHDQVLLGQPAPVRPSPWRK